MRSTTPTRRRRRLAALGAGAALVVLATAAPAMAAPGDITTIAGTGAFGGGGDGGPAVAAQLTDPVGVAVDGTGNVYVADGSEDVVRRIDTGGVITTVAGGAGLVIDGVPATQSAVQGPGWLAVGPTDDLFISEFIGGRVRRVDAATGTITTVAGGGSNAPGDGGAATDAQLQLPGGIAVDASGALFVVDQLDHRVRRVEPGTGVISTVAGTGVEGAAGDGGPAVAAQLAFPRAVAIADDGSLLITDAGNERVRRVDAATGTITTVAGTGTSGSSGDGGPATSADLRNPAGIVADGVGGFFFSDSDNHRVRRVDGATGTITTVAGTGTAGFGGDGGPAAAAQLSGPQGLALTADGGLVVGDQLNRRVRLVADASPVPAVGSGWAATAALAGLSVLGALAAARYRRRGSPIGAT